MHLDIQYFLHQYGYFGVFVIFVSEMLGAPFPAETTLTVCGVAWSRGIFGFLPLWLSASCGNIIGSTIAYAIGYFLGYPVILRYGRFFGVTKERLKKAEDKLAKHRNNIVFFAKFISGIRILTPLLSGITRLNFAWFSVLNAISAFIWSAFFIIEGKYLSLIWTWYHPLIQRYGGLFIGVIGFVIVVMWIRIRLRRRARSKVHDSTTPE